MPSNKYAEIVVDLTPTLPLADVIDMPSTEQASFYTRNSGGLPRLDDAAASDYGREALPNPVDPEPDTVFNRIKEFISVNRPSWLA